MSTLAVRDIEYRGRTLERVTEAWVAVSSLTRRAVFAAVVTSMALGYAFGPSISASVQLALVGSVLAVAALVDVHEEHLPNPLLELAGLAVVGCAAASGDLSVCIRTTAGFLIAGLLMGLVAATRGVGMGDLKMSAVVGASTASGFVLAAPIAIAVAAFVASAVAAARRLERMVLGPSLWLGWAVASAIGTRWWR